MTLDSEAAMQRLRQGNQRYHSGSPVHPNQDAASRRLALEGQEPYAVVIACSDSRVPPELIFDAGIGEIFVIRTAGNVLDDIALGSVEYAVAHLGTRLVVVLGHTQCGAVTAAVQGGGAHGNLKAVVDAIRPAIPIAGSGSIPAVIEANARVVIESMRKRSQVIDEACSQGLSIMAAIYDIGSGKVDFLE